MEPAAFPLHLALKVEEGEEEAQSPELEGGPTDTQKVRICSESAWVPALFDEVAIYFSDEEWEVLTEPQKALYREVMRMNYETVLSLGEASCPLCPGGSGPGEWPPCPRGGGTHLPAS
ncbi:pogo transposable element derived with KRAB domain [Phyllostomus discolor]|uniref:Pogo transposable element derived with KRAB domain n=1 Tax=Phyllostomus discolor TaxID=89673 RepID=A0A833YHB9_9CHIR|nr:pogo transposable element derived with KRAB domain [Phyllostomus discolor]